MRHVRSAVALVAIMALLASGVAAAATPRPVCNLVTDAAGDANAKDTGAANPFPLPVGPSTSPVPFPVVNAGPSSDALDITSADLAADKKKLTAVIRVKQLAMTDPTAAPTGIRWSVTFVAEEIQFTVAAHTDPTGAARFNASYFIPANGIGYFYDGGVTGFFDLKKNEIHVTAPNDLFAAQATIKPGKRLSQLSASASDELVVPEPSHKASPSGVLLEGTLGYTDSATSTKSYVIGVKSCVTPGK